MSYMKRTSRVQRVQCCAVRYRQQGDEFSIFDALCGRHSSVEFGGACSREHQQQCLKYAPEPFSAYETLMRERHELPAIAESMGELRVDIGMTIFNAMEVSLTNPFSRTKRR
jgi:hypothetical protein